LPFFSTTDNAKDLKVIIDKIQLNEGRNQSIFLNGHSYGTFLANRFCQLFPGFASLVVSDGTLMGNDMKLKDFDIYGQKWLLNPVLNRCSNDDFCKSKLGSDPAKYIKDTIQMLSSGHCSDLVSELGGVDVLKVFFISPMVLNNNRVYSLPYIVLYRLRSCSWTDKIFLRYYGLLKLLSTYYQLTLQGLNNSYSFQLLDDSMNFFVSYLMKVSELGRHPIPTLQNLTDGYTALPLGTYYSQNKLYQVQNDSKFANFSTYDPLDELYGNDTRTQWLFVSGELDRNTPILFMDNILKNFKNFTHFIVKNGPHTAGFASICGLNAVAQFFQSRGKNLNFPACSPELPGISFQGETDLLKILGFSFYSELWSSWIFLSNIGMIIAVVISFVVLIILSVVFLVSVIVLRRKFCPKKEDDHVEISEATSLYGNVQ